jgi:hypothetical protein
MVASSVLTSRASKSSNLALVIQVPVDTADKGPLTFRTAIAGRQFHLITIKSIGCRPPAAGEALAQFGSRPMGVPIDELWEASERALVGAYAEARRQFVEKKFARDTQRARLEWMKARAFLNGSGGVTERKMAVDVSEELARKGQELREMTRDLELLRVEVDVIAIVMRLRGAHAPADDHNEEATAGGEADGEGT